MTYYTIHETSALTFQSSRLGDVIATERESGLQVYFQTGDAGTEILDILEESPPEFALHIFMDDFFAMAREQAACKESAA